MIEWHHGCSKFQDLACQCSCMAAINGHACCTVFGSQPKIRILFRSRPEWATSCPFWFAGISNKCSLGTLFIIPCVIQSMNKNSRQTVIGLGWGSSILETGNCTKEWFLAQRQKCESARLQRGLPGQFHLKNLRVNNVKDWMFASERHRYKCEGKSKRGITGAGWSGCHMDKRR